MSRCFINARTRLSSDLRLLRRPQDSTAPSRGSDECGWRGLSVSGAAGRRDFGLETVFEKGRYEGSIAIHMGLARRVVQPLKLGHPIEHDKPLQIEEHQLAPVPEDYLEVRGAPPRFIHWLGKAQAFESNPGRHVSSGSIGRRGCDIGPDARRTSPGLQHECSRCQGREDAARRRVRDARQNLRKFPCARTRRPVA